jgi:hypothetical protein
MMKKMAFALVPGHAYSFEYPRYNYPHLPDKRQVRRVAVSSIRDLRQVPLDPLTAKRNPSLKRGRFLITGEDLDLGQERSFYIERMTELNELAPEEERDYAVVVRGLVRYKTNQLCAAIAFQLGCERGSVWGRLT